jgi:hypothetical protein
VDSIRGRFAGGNASVSSSVLENSEKLERVNFVAREQIGGKGFVRKLILN